MALEAQQRIPDITLEDNGFMDGQILRGFDLNKVTAILKVGVNANYDDLKALLNIANKWGKIEGSIEEQTDLIKKLDECVKEIQLENYYTKTESDNKYQPKGNFLTEIPSEYITEMELVPINEEINQIKESISNSKSVKYDETTGELTIVSNSILYDELTGELTI